MTTRSRSASRGVTIGLWLWVVALVGQFLLAAAQLDGWTSTDGWIAFAYLLAVPPLFAVLLLVPVRRKHWPITRRRAAWVGALWMALTPLALLFAMLGAVVLLAAPCAGLTSLAGAAPGPRQRM